ncbi:MAG: QueT transporter family protein [Lactobacillaceae bacterium]|jgi:uncharacterized membrane protein|nr:QueT transporter family protein [Lactobacillaceae bacterium]
MRKNESVRQITLTAVIAALYIALGMIAPINLRGNAIQLRVGEGLNHLSIFNKRYVLSLTIGVFIFNLFFGGLGIVDAISGALQTLVMTGIVNYISKKISNKKLQFVVSTIVISLMMFWIALELIYLKIVPANAFWLTYFQLFISELISLTVGGIIIYQVSKILDLRK